MAIQLGKIPTESLGVGYETFPCKICTSSIRCGDTCRGGVSFKRHIGVFPFFLWLLGCHSKLLITRVLPVLWRIRQHLLCQFLTKGVEVNWFLHGPLLLHGTLRALQINIVRDSDSQSFGMQHWRVPIFPCSFTLKQT